MSLEALRRLAGGPKVQAAQACAGFLNWCAQYQPPTRFTGLEIDGVTSPTLYAAPETPKGPVIFCCARAPGHPGVCQNIDGSPKIAPEPTGKRFALLEVDNPVDRDAVADGVVMAFFALRGGHGTVV